MTEQISRLHAEPGVPLIALEELMRRLRDPGLAIVNVLPREAFLAGRIPGSLSLPLAEVGDRAREVLPRLSQDAAVYCGGPT